MSDYSIGEAAEILGVTTRTLRHWDQVELLSPLWRSTHGDYRIYTDRDLEKGFQILIYREVGMPLKEIKAILNKPESRYQSLSAQRRTLQKKITALHRMVRAVDDLLKEDYTLSKDSLQEVFGPDWEGWQHEAENRWGETKEWAQSQESLSHMSKDDLESAQAEHERFCAALKNAFGKEVLAGSPEARELIDLHATTIQRWYDVDLEKQVLLSRLYVHDERFHSTYGRRELVEYFQRLVAEEARLRGCDPENATWES
ncbi:MerR family transcriptional regulator [Corynebacterium poyangense]|uniref:MerR family transcriptional regulator n=1 Tax=Corynebacterium poyangense TaxID=2684405 RepID=A0A7H0SM07_9CORY|nr:MerR family transcriptional regulator [Corynebacterium poyangense]QNQ89582.1 MerR family transcriptional regulator [Corynebacterium poyangense]